MFMPSRDAPQRQIGARCRAFAAHENDAMPLPPDKSGAQKGARARARRRKVNPRREQFVAIVAGQRTLFYPAPRRRRTPEILRHADRRRAADYDRS